MPELLDLPPELFEHIFFEYECLVYYDSEDIGVIDTTAPNFRLASRYIEQCTRRMFAETYFDVRRITMADDASVKRFCAVAQVPDLAKFVDKVELYAENDQHAHETSASFDRSGLVDALRGFSNIAELIFHNSPYAQTGDLKYEVVSTLLFLPRPLEEGLRFDISSSLDLMLFIAEEAGIRPVWMSTTSEAAHSDDYDYQWREPTCGLTDCAAISRGGALWSEVEVLTLSLHEKQLGPGVTDEIA
jgi:hypothetical protein